MSSTNNNIPSEFICPVTKTLMNDPMVSRYGHSFERKAILEWLNGEGNTACPVTGKSLRPSNLVSNKKLRWKIRHWNGAESAIEDDATNFSIDFIGTVAIPPKKFFCQLTNEIMTSPMMTRDAVNYERQAILGLLDTVDICPVTGHSLCANGIVPNYKLQKEIEEWQQEDNNGGAAMKKIESSPCTDVQAMIATKKLGKKADNDVVANTIRSSSFARFLKKGKPSYITQKVAKTA
jgi:hypothetical protein